MKNIILINQSTGYLMIDILNAYTEKYDEVILLTGDIKPMERQLNENVIIRKILPYIRKNMFTRIFSWLWCSIQIFFILIFKYKKHEIIFVTNPPFAYLFSYFLNRIFSVIVYDTYPDALKNIGISKNHFIFKTWSKLNKKIFNKAKMIYTLSDGMALQLSQYISINKIRVIHNWAGSGDYQPIPKESNRFIANNHLEGKFIIMYSGNMGYTHNVEVFLDVAKLLVIEKRICFLFIGDGKKRMELEQRAKKNNLKNCIFLDWQDSNLLPFSFAAADIGLISLNEDSALVSVPSKTYNLMAAGIPLLTVSPENSELAILIKKKKNGRNFSSEKIKEIADFIIFCKNNKQELSTMSRNSLAASKDYTFKNAKKYVLIS